MSLSSIPSAKKFPSATLCDLSDFFVPRASSYLKLIDEKTILGNKRREWEYNYIAESAENLGLLDGTKKALGVGTGFESLLFFFARNCSEVLGTDLYSLDTQWQVAQFDNFEEIYKKAPFDFPRERLKFQNADMRSLPVPDNYYDFVWSTSTIEHPTSPREVYLAVQEMVRAVKPGGYVMFTTEFCISEPPYFLPHLNALDPVLFEKYFLNNTGIKLIGEVDLDFNWQSIATEMKIRRYVPSSFFLGQEKLRYYAPQGVVQSLGCSLIVPIGIVLQKTEGKMISWEDLRTDPLEARRSHRFKSGFRSILSFLG